jgi:predicted transcriptional regulator
MVTISHVVQDIINKHVFLQEAINHGIVSYNKLAEDIKPDIEKELSKKVKHNAIVMSLRRYAEKLENKKEKMSFNYFRETLLKTDICYIVIEEAETSLDRIKNLYSEIEFKVGGIFNVVQGNYEIGIVTNSRYKEKFLDLLKEEKILRTVDDLVVISLTYSKDLSFTPGILYNVSRFIAWENINILNVLHTPKELSFVISKKDAMRCYNTLERMVKPYKNQQNLD